MISNPSPLVPVIDKEALGDWSNLKGTRYHLVYALWLLLRRHAQTVHFYQGNDLLARPVVPPEMRDSATGAVAISTEGVDRDTDVWIQLKATQSPWTVTELLSENLLFNFVCNAVMSERNKRKWRVELVTEGDIRRTELLEFVAAPINYTNLKQNLDKLVDRARSYLQQGGISTSADEVCRLATKILSDLAKTEAVSLRALKAEIECELAHAGLGQRSVRRTASLLVGAMVLDSGAGPEKAHPYTVAWINQEAGFAVISDCVFDNDPIAACDEAVASSIKQLGTTIYRPDRFAARARLRKVLTHFLDAKESVFLLTGRSGSGKTWGIADWLARHLNGQARLLICGNEVRTDESLAQLVANHISRYSARDWRPGDVLVRLRAAASEKRPGRFLVVIDDFRITAHTAEECRRFLGRLARSASESQTKVLVSCQQETWDLFRPQAEIPVLEVFNPSRESGSPRGSPSFVLDIFTPDEFKSALSLRLPPGQFDRLVMHFRDSAFLPLHNPRMMDLFVEQQIARFGAISDPPIPLHLDDLLARTVEDRLQRVAESLNLDAESVRRAFDAAADFLWCSRHREITARELLDSLNGQMPDLSQEGLRAFRREGFLTLTGAMGWADALIGDFVWARRLLSLIVKNQQVLRELNPNQDQTVIEAMVRMASNGPELAERLMQLSPIVRPAVAKGLSQRSPAELRAVALTWSLTRASDEFFADADGCAALGALAARGRRGFESRRAWRRIIEMYLSSNSEENHRGIHALASLFEFAPKLASKLVRLRFKIEVSKPSSNSERKDLGSRLDYTLRALRNVHNSQAAQIAMAVLDDVKPVVADPHLPKRESLIDSVDQIRGKCALFLDQSAVDNLVQELRAPDRETRLRAASAIRPAVYEAPNRLFDGIVNAIRTEDDPDVLLRLFWASHPLLQVNCPGFLDAVAASAAMRWDDPRPTASALAVLGDAAKTESETVARMLPKQLDRLPKWAQAGISDLLALAWWKCGEKLSSARSTLVDLQEPVLYRVPKLFQVFSYRGAFVARLGEACLASSVSSFECGVSMTTHYDRQMPYCFSDIDKVLESHAKEIAGLPVLRRIAEPMLKGVSAEQQFRRFTGGRGIGKILDHARYNCARDMVEGLALLASHLEQPLELIQTLPRDWQAIRAARCLLDDGLRSSDVISFANEACNERAQGGSGQAGHERNLCMAQLASLHPEPAQAIKSDGARFHGMAFALRHNDPTDKIATLIDANPGQCLTLLDQAISQSDQMPVLYRWHEHARSWRALLLSGAYHRMFDPRAIGKPAATRLVADILEVSRSVPSSAEQAEYIAVYEAIMAWLQGMPTAPPQSMEGQSPIRKSHALAINLLKQGEQSAKQMEWHSLLMNRCFWWQSMEFRWGENCLQSGWGRSYYLILALPAVRLACVAIARHCGDADPIGLFINHRYQTLSELDKIDSRYWQDEKQPVQLKKRLSEIESLSGTRGGDERIEVQRGNLLCRLDRHLQAEKHLRLALDHPLLMRGYRGSALYDLACVAAKTGRMEECEKLLPEALTLVPRLKEHLGSDPDFESVRDAGWFKSLQANPKQS